MTLKKRIAVLVFFVLTSQISYSQSNIHEDLLIGKWKFVKFDWPNFVPDTAKIIKEANKHFKDAIYTFTKDKRLLITQPNGPKGYSTNLIYKIKKDKVYTWPVESPQNEPQILEIDLLDKNYLKFYVKGFDPTVTFKRISD